MFSDHSAAILISVTEAVGTQADVPSFHIPISEIGKWRDQVANRGTNSDKLVDEAWADI